MAARISLTADFPKRVIDQQAETHQELLRKWPQSEFALFRFEAKKVATGAWEKVWKKVGNCLKPAYRRSSKK